MIGAKYLFDYFYINSRGRNVCFKYHSEKRVKTKVLNFIKKEHEESKILAYLKSLDLKLVCINDSKRYKSYYIIDIDKTLDFSEIV